MEGEDVFGSRQIVTAFMKENNVSGILLYSSISGDIEFNLALEGDRNEFPVVDNITN